MQPKPLDTQFTYKEIRYNYALSHALSYITLHFYGFLHTHVLIANFLLLIDVPIQGCTQQLSIYKIFTLDILHWNFTARYDVSTQYLGSHTR